MLASKHQIDGNKVYVVELDGKNGKGIPIIVESKTKFYVGLIK